MEESSPNPTPRLLASTLETYQTSISTSHERECALLTNGKLPNGTIHPSSWASNKKESNVFRSIEWTPDGTSLVTTSEDNCLRTFVVPPDLLDEHESPIHLMPYCITPHPATLYTHAIYPFFSLSSPTTSVILTSHPSHPIQLRSLLTSATHASYPIIHAPTEQYLTPHSLVWTEDGTSFVAGMDGAITVWDIETQKSTTWKTERKGIVSSLGLKGEMLAMGSFKRWVEVYGGNGMDEQMGSFVLPGEEEGGGVTAVKWDDRGVELYVAERKSDVVWVYDVRSLRAPSRVLKGRRARGHQRLGIDARGGVVHGGGDDGMVRTWKDQEEGAGVEWKVGDDAVGGVAVHGMGNIVATCSGTRKISIEDDDGGGSLVVMDNNVKIWLL